MAKPELGTKRACPACATKYYDLNRNPIVCPSCGAVFELSAREKASPARAVAPDTEAETEEDEDLAEPDVASLEEVEEETEGADPSTDEDEPDVPDLPVDDNLDIEEDDGLKEDDTFLDEDEEEGDDVTGLLDVDAEPDEET